MRWRIGQGIGPRLTWRQRRVQDVQLSTGQGHPSGSDSNNPDDDEAKKYTYVPRDTPILVAGRKDNSQGRGYDPGMGLHEVLGIDLLPDQNWGVCTVHACHREMVSSCLRLGEWIRIGC
jgi:hypothetical protein